MVSVCSCRAHVFGLCLSIAFPGSEGGGQRETTNEAAEAPHDMGTTYVRDTTSSWLGLKT